jgi:hypothetical protein
LYVESGLPSELLTPLSCVFGDPILERYRLPLSWTTPRSLTTPFYLQLLRFLMVPGPSLGGCCSCIVYFFRCPETSSPFSLYLSSSNLYIAFPKVPALVDLRTRASRCRSRLPLSLGTMPLSWACSLMRMARGSHARDNTGAVKSRAPLVA